MRADVTFVRDAQDRALSPETFVLERRTFHRPVSRFRLSLRSRSDVLRARKAGVSAYLLEPWVVEALGYPLTFRPRLLLSRGLVGAVDTSFPVLPMLNPDVPLNPRIEDVVVAMLRIDPLGARRIVRENAHRLHANTLLRRIIQEEVESRAFRVRLDEFVPGLPQVGEPLSRQELAAEDAQEYSRGYSL